MLNRKLHPESWQAFFDRLSKRLHTAKQQRYAKLRLAMPEMPGTRDMAHWLPLVGMTYDPKASVLYVMMDGLTHRANQPDIIWAHETADGDFDVFLVLCGDGCRLTVELSDIRFAHDASVFRRDPSRRILARGMNEAEKLWKLLMAFLPRDRQENEDDYRTPQWHGSATRLDDLTGPEIVVHVPQSSERARKPRLSRSAFRETALPDEVGAP